MSKHSENFDDENDDPTTDDFDDYNEEEEVVMPQLYFIRITRKQIEMLLSHGQVDVESIEICCDVCSSDIELLPTLVLED